MNDPLLGKQLGEYRLETLLGQGGMARVYRALDVRLKRYVAVKVIDAPFRQDTDYIIRFEREAQAIAQLEHGHIVRLYRYGEQDDLLYMAMQYVEGANFDAILSQYEAEGEYLETADASHIIRQVCLALDYAHSQGVIHRDVKPANIMLNKEGEAFVTDFGLALLVDLGTRGEVFGTPEYIAPEQAISSAGAVPQSDIYSLGVMLYRIFTGVLPFSGDDPLDVAMRHMTEPPRPPRELRPEISPQLEAVILKSLAKEAADRYPNGRALADALDSALPTAALAPRSPRATVAERVTLGVALLPPLPAGTPPLDALERPTAPLPAGTPPLDGLERPTAPLPAVPAAWIEMSSTQPEAAATAASDEPDDGGRPFWALGLGVGGGALIFLCLLLVIAGWLYGRNRDDSLAEVGGAETAVTPTLAPGMATTPLPGETPPVAARMDGRTLWLPIIMVDERGGADLPPPDAVLPPPDAVLPPTAVAVAPAPQSYQLLFATRSDDSLFVINRSNAPFPLARLQLGAGAAAVMGAEWGLAELPPNSCVAVWKAQGNPRAPGVTCDLVGERLTRSNRQVFWEDGFILFYNERPVEHSCGRRVAECSVTLVP